MELKRRPGITAVAVASAGIIVVAPAAPPLPRAVQVPAIELSAFPGPLVDLPDSLLPSLDDTTQASLASIITDLAALEIAAGVALSGLIATPFSYLSVAVTSLGTAISDLGGVFTSIGTAVAGVSALPAGIAELITAGGVAITQGLVTPIAEFLIKLVSGGSADAVGGLPDELTDPATLLGGGGLTQSLDPGAALDVSQLSPDLLAVF